MATENCQHPVAASTETLAARYEDVIDRARELAANVVNSLPTGDEASIAEQVAAQAGESVAAAAEELGYNLEDFRDLVERETARLQDRVI